MPQFARQCRTDVVIVLVLRSVDCRELAISPEPDALVRKTCQSVGRFANADNLLSQCERFLLEREPANKIIDGMERIINRRRHDIARRESVSEADCERIRGAFTYEGFRLSAASSD